MRTKFVAILAPALALGFLAVTAEASSTRRSGWAIRHPLRQAAEEGGRAAVSWQREVKADVPRS